MNRISIFNSLVITVSLVLFAFAVVMAVRDQWNRGTFFLVIVLILVSLIERPRNRRFW